MGYGNQPANELSCAEAERLALLIEECSETIRAATKILRHGYNSKGYDNRGDLAREIGHVQLAFHLMVSCQDVTEALVTDSEFEKSKSIDMFLHHNSYPK